MLQRYTRAGKSEGKPWHKFVTFLGHQICRLDREPGHKDTTAIDKIDIDPSQSPARGILENFFRCSIPPSIQSTFDLADPMVRIKKIDERC